MFLVSKLYKVVDEEDITLAISENLNYLKEHFSAYQIVELFPNSAENFVDFVLVENTYGNGYGISDVTILENGNYDVLMYQERFFVPNCSDYLYAEMDRLAASKAYYNDACPTLAVAVGEHRKFWMSDCDIPEDFEVPIFVFTKQEFWLLLSSGFESSTLICNISDY